MITKTEYWPIPNPIDPNLTTNPKVSQGLSWICIPWKFEISTPWKFGCLFLIHGFPQVFHSNSCIHWKNMFFWLQMTMEPYIVDAAWKILVWICQMPVERNKDEHIIYQQSPTTVDAWTYSEDSIIIWMCLKLGPTKLQQHQFSSKHDDPHHGNLGYIYSVSIDSEILGKLVDEPLVSTPGAVAKPSASKYPCPVRIGKNKTSFVTVWYMLIPS